MKRAVQKAARATLADCGLAGAELSVLLVGDDRIREINREYLGRDKPTNVLSLSQRESVNGAPAPENELLGDVIISVETCARHAEKAGMPAAEEVLFCLVHGIAHLVGHDHEAGAGREAARRMRAFETDLFRRVAKPFAEGVKPGGANPKAAR
ncbi:rRNA maturation RNase YbeY [bacterium]|nr:rRNA maturation RNase YbeY [bacterium]